MKLQLHKPEIRDQLAFINQWFAKLSSNITQLEDTKLSIIESVAIIHQIKSDLSKAPGDGSRVANTKFIKTLEKNVGFSTLSKISYILTGTGNMDSLINGEEGFTPADIAAYGCAPITSCDVGQLLSVQTLAS